uniref:Uncharacterized protein n=1 Tax=Myotis myotis TaxID=51298 RepID=A0A7J7RSG6_MYOMY|nr:hypothetical protein mMyoMyo1_010185 [Myotis myotis]
MENGTICIIKGQWPERPDDRSPGGALMGLAVRRVSGSRLPPKPPGTAGLGLAMSRAGPLENKNKCPLLTSVSLLLPHPGQCTDIAFGSGVLSHLYQRAVLLKVNFPAETGLAQWIERRPVD